MDLYIKNSGRCVFCNDDTLWGDAPHKLDCSYYIFYQIVQDCQDEDITSIDIDLKIQRKAIINVFNFAFRVPKN